MIATVKPVTSLLIRFSALLMVLVFLAIPLTEAFHDHPKAFSFAGPSGKAVLQKHHVPCKVCAYFLQVQSHQLHYGGYTSFTVIPCSSWLLLFDPAAQVASGFKIGCANKGPPSAS